MRQCCVLVLCCLSSVALSQDQVCSEGDCRSEQTSALMQHTKHASNLKPAGKKKKTEQASHAQTVSLLLAEMNDMVESKGEIGMNPDDINQINNIRAMVDETLLPTVLDQVQQLRDELDALYQDIVNCHGHAVGVVNTTEIKETTVDTILKQTRECEIREDIIKTKNKKVCEGLNRTRLAIYLPGDEDFPPPSAPDEELIKYLHLMDEFFCGRYEVFYHEWEECEDLQENYTITHQECVWLQKELGEESCKWKMQLDKSCEYFDTCWTEAVKKYNARKRDIADLQQSLEDEFSGATKIECLWSAWHYEGMPCNVNKTRVKECHEFLPNLTNVTIPMPPPPPPPECSTASVEIDVCSEDWVNINFGAIGIAKEMIQDLHDNCVPCPSYEWTSAPVVTKHTHMFNMRHAGGAAYIKTYGDLGCNAFVETDEPNAQSITITAHEGVSKMVAQISTNTTSLVLNLEDGVASVPDSEEDVVVMFRDSDELVMSISAGRAIFTKNGENFGNLPLPEGMIAGFGRVTLCTNPGGSMEAEFGLVTDEMWAR